jgi:hypothetical protein
VEFAYREGVDRYLLKSYYDLKLPTLLRKDEVTSWPQEKLPIVLEWGEVIFQDEIKAQGFCQCNRKACVDHDQKVYCYFPKRLSTWVIKTALYSRCYDQKITCPRCKKKQKRGHIGKLNVCGMPYKNQKRQTD